MRSLIILGSTGSIGENTLRVVRDHRQTFRVAGLAARTRVDRLIEQALAFDVKQVAVADPEAARRAAVLAKPYGIRVFTGAEGICRMVEDTEADLVLCALVGMSGLKPSLAALHTHKRLALSTKEVLVSAGELVMRERLRCGVPILPVDSEHSAIFQALQSAAFDPFCVSRAEEDGRGAEDRIGRLVLTASGGPFFAHPEVDFDRVTREQALNHPKWNMGPKVTVDSATMMNKGLEILEARWLFNIPVDRIDVLVHPQSIVHSLVTFRDGATLAQLSPPDMRLPIQFALTWPERLPSSLPTLDLAATGGLTFCPPDESRFPCLRLAREAMRVGGTLPAVMNGADEIAVAAFLEGRIPFSGIWSVVEQVMEGHDPMACDDLENISAADAWARRQAEETIRRG